MTPAIAFRVMHAPWGVDRRRHLLDLRIKLGPVRSPHSFAVIEDTHRAGTWPTARRAWIAAATAGATHAFVMQDDMHPCANFIETCERLIALRPADALCLATARTVVDRVSERWLVSTGGCWGGATILPVAIARDFIAWSNRYLPHPSYQIEDDARLRLFLAVRNYPTYYPLPTLMDHVGMVSLVGHNTRTQNMTPRRFIGPSDPRTIDWSADLDAPYRAPANSYPATFARRLLRDDPDRAVASGFAALVATPQGDRHADQFHRHP